ncbi:MAG TPA: nucleoside hydrolase [Caulobacteraceae bacterium]|nr:nucleoside hydrolase [Caulobacteraceae bacterium]
MKLIIDTDVGDDYDDIFTLAVALASPEVDLQGVTTVAGDVALRARLVIRLLALADRLDVPVGVGLPTPIRAPFTHRRWAEAGPPLTGDEPHAADFILRRAAAHPGEVTVLAIGPLSNLAEALRRDSAAFRQLKRIVLMGGSVRRGYRDMSWQPDRGPSPEHNIVSDIGAAKAVFESGAALAVCPLDAAMVALDEAKRAQIFTRSTPVTDALALTYLQWAAVGGRALPILFDTVTLAYALEPSICRTEPLRLAVDDEGYTRIAPGAPNADVCVDCNEDRFHRWMMPRLLGQSPRA